MHRARASRSTARSGEWPPSTRLRTRRCISLPMRRLSSRASHWSSTAVCGCAPRVFCPDSAFMQMRCPMKRLAVLFMVLTAANLAFAQGSARLLVLNKEDATFVIVNPTSGTVLGKVPVGQGPHELVVSTDRKYAFASNYGNGPAPGSTISMIDIAAQKEVRRIDVSPLRRPHGLWFANGKLYFSAEADKKIARYDPATDKIDWQFETGQNATHMVVLTKDG